FGGIDNNSNAVNDTWEWDGDRWNGLAPVHSPAPRAWAGLASDLPRGRCVLYGGTSPTTSFLTDTWEWDGARGDWLQRTPAPLLGSRYGSGSAFDSARVCVVLFGGWRSGGAVNETFELAPVAPGLFQPFGQGCPGSSGTVGMRALPGAFPFLGGTFAVDLTNL